MSPTMTDQPTPGVCTTSTSVAPTGLPSATDAVSHTLLNTLLREVCAPDHQSAIDGQHLLLRLPRRDALLSVQVRRPSRFGAHRFSGPAHVRDHGSWRPLDWSELAALIHDELTLASGVTNEEFLDQVASSHTAIRLALDARQDQGTPMSPAVGGPDSHPGLAPYLASEQSLVFGHRFHPTPKARTGDPAAWLDYAPEHGATFTLHHLAVRSDLVAQATACDPLEGAGHGHRPTRLHHLPALDDQRDDLPDGYHLLPAHPWQLRLLAEHPGLRAALADGRILDLGRGRHPYAATASVRTLYDGQHFLKFSLDVRITNCLRKNADYELAGAVALTRHLTPILATLQRSYPGTVMLREPAYRSVALPGAGGRPDRTLLEGLGVIVRDGLGAHLRPGVTPLLAGALADEYPTSPAHVSHLLAGADAHQTLDWWERYLDLLVPPVLSAFLDHGLVLEPHLQNVVVGVDPDGLPAQIFLRDLEGTKLVPEHHHALLDALPARIAGPLTYDAARGWDRVTYCLLVNHLAELLAALADRHPDQEAALWGRVRAALERHADQAGCPPPLAALLAGVPLPAKANLLTRWSRSSDKEAGYVRLPSPLAEGLLGCGGPR